MFSRPDRFAGTFVESGTLTIGVSGSYQVSGKTSLNASVAAAMTDYETAGFSSTDSYTGQVTAYWEATPLFRIGPSLRFSTTESATSGDRDAWALLVRAGYTLTDKVSLSASAGVEFEEHSRVAAGGDETRFTGDFSGGYRLDDLWSFDARVNYRTLPSPSTMNYSIDDLGFTFSVSRNLDNGSVRGGVSYSISDYEAVGPVMIVRPDEELFGVFLAHRINLFDERVALDSAVRFSDNNGLVDWDRFQLSTGFNFVF